jgi:SAM-dependent methyltransferase
VGGGGGSVAAWLAKRVNPGGHVLVTDIDPRFLESLSTPNLEVRRHDISRDSLPETGFDLIHARLVLIHLPDRSLVLERLAAALKPGGWLVIEEFDALSATPDPIAIPGEFQLKTQIAMTQFMRDRGNEPRCGRLLLGSLRSLGFGCVDTEARLFVAQCESAGAAMIRANYRQLKDAMIRGGYITEVDFEADLMRLDDPRFQMPIPMMWSAWGRRP